MKKIPSFTIDHIKLNRGIYVSRKDEIGGETVTTLDVYKRQAMCHTAPPSSIGCSKYRENQA